MISSDSSITLSFGKALLDMQLGNKRLTKNSIPLLSEFSSNQTKDS